VLADAHYLLIEFWQQRDVGDQGAEQPFAVTWTGRFGVPQPWQVRSERE
jgi:NADH:ubiquinone oxidoreductase subunit 5 (subunit L)/multisubunit Na+/H+ antiporter MnhA subunit